MAEDTGNGMDMGAAAAALFPNMAGDKEAGSDKEPVADHIPKHTEATTPHEIQEHNDARNDEMAQQWEAESLSTFSDVDMNSAADFVATNFTPEMREILNGPLGKNPIVIAQVLALAKRFG